MLIIYEGVRQGRGGAGRARAHCRLRGREQPDAHAEGRSYRDHADGPVKPGHHEAPLRCNRRAFQCALDQWLKPPNTVLYVDDNETNLVVAAEMGMSTLLATPAGRWDREVDRWVEGWGPGVTSAGRSR